MHKPADPSPLDPALRSLLDRLRRRVWIYVWIETAAAVLIALSLAFWLSLVLDWWLEPPVWVRAGGLLAAVALALGMIYRYLLRRWFVPLRDGSLALVLERRFPFFAESLLTSVEMAEHPQHAAEFHADMLAEARARALRYVEGLRLRQVFRPAPAASKSAAALVFAGSILLFGLLAGDALGVWAERNLLLSDRLWPRKTRLEIDGFPGGMVRVARGSDVQIVVRADTSQPLVPDSVELRYVTPQGARVRDRVGREGVAVPPRDAFQRYTHVIKGLSESLDFDVLGGDDRIRDLRIEVVDSPVLTEIALECEFPAYTGREPRRQPAHGITPLPQGTAVVVHAVANKPLRQVSLRAARGQDLVPLGAIELDGRTTTFSYALGEVRRDQTLLLTLHDADGIVSRDPVRLAISAVPDRPPQVAVRLRGIGAAVTPQAKLPVEGSISDDYGLAAAWFVLQADDGTSLEQEFSTPPAGRQELKLELQQEEALDLQGMNLAIGRKLRVRVSAADNCSLAANPLAGGAPAARLLALLAPPLPWPASRGFAGPLGLSRKPSGVADVIESLWLAVNRANVGAGEEFQLNVVSPPELLALLESRELALRRRLETILEETTTARDSLIAKRFNAPLQSDGETNDAAAASNSAESTENPAEEAAAPDKMKSLIEGQRVRVSRAMASGQRNANETLGLAGAFDDMHEEIINNRLDASDLKKRLKESIVTPLERIAGESFPEIDRRLKKLDAALASAQPAGAALDEARAQADAVLVELQAVLDQMLHLEDFNQLVDVLREVMEMHSTLSRETIAKHKEKARSVLEE